MRACATAALCLLSGCAPVADSLPLPAQRAAPPGIPALPARTLLSLDAPDSRIHFVHDIGGADGKGRWTGPRAALRFLLPSPAPWTALAVFDWPAEAGSSPATLMVNGMALERVTLDRPGSYRIAKPVPEHWIRTDADTLWVLEVEKPWGDRRGVLLMKAGFAPAR